MSAAGTVSHNSKRRERLFLAITVAAFGLPLFYGLDHVDLANDEAIYAYAVDGILETGEWMSPKSIPHTTGPGDPREREFGTTFLEKPPLKFWITAAPIWLGILPRDEFGMRFMDALLGVLAFGYVYWIGRRLVDPLCGFASVWLLFVHSPLLFGHGIRSNVMEASVMLAYAGGIAHFLAWRDGDGRQATRHVYAVAGWIAFAVTFFAKPSKTSSYVLGMATDSITKTSNSHAS